MRLALLFVLVACGGSGDAQVKCDPSWASQFGATPPGGVIELGACDEACAVPTPDVIASLNDSGSAACTVKRGLDMDACISPMTVNGVMGCCHVIDVPCDAGTVCIRDSVQFWECE